MYAQTVSRIPCRLIHADVLVLVSEFVVVVILSEWWSVPITADHCGHISASRFSYS